MKFSNKKYLLIICIIFSSHLGFSETLAIIANKGTKTASITVDDAARIFLKKSLKLPGNGVAIPAQQSSSSYLFEKFCEHVLKKKPRQVRAYWNLKVMSGRLTPPVILDNDREVLEFVSNKKGAIGYVLKRNVGDGVKILLEIPL